MVSVYQHLAFQNHITPPGHPEQVARRVGERADPKQPRYLQTVRGEGYMLAPD